MTLISPKSRRLSLAHRYSKKQENRAAKRLQGAVVKRSGAGPYTKGDIRIKGIMRLETKCTAKKSFSVTLDMLTKIEEASLPSGEIPAIEIVFLDPVSGREKYAVAVVPRYVLHIIKEREGEEKT